MLEKLTVVILTQDEPETLESCLHFWGKQQCKVLVLDGSARPFTGLETMSVSENISYRHVPGDLSARYAKAAQTCDTKYIAMCHTGECYLPSALGFLVHALELNQSLVAAVGHSMSYQRDDRGAVLATLENPALLKDFSLQSSGASRAVKLMRFLRFFHGHAVMHTNVWRAGVGLMCDHPEHIKGARNLQFELITAFLGPTFIFPIVHRLARASSALSKDNGVPENDMLELWIDDTRAAEQQAFLAETARCLSPLIGMPKPSLMLELTQAMTAFVAARSLEVQRKKGRLRDLRDGFLRRRGQSLKVEPLEHFLHRLKQDGIDAPVQDIKATLCAINGAQENVA